ncbi:hypothetical protein ONZ45_g5912 [Pleurotus djamor]|nr:hypothetical protein ONZ45_g5912 [Pleurotus djamor]
MDPDTQANLNTNAPAKVPAPMRPIQYPDDQSSSAGTFKLFSLTQSQRLAENQPPPGGEESLSKRFAPWNVRRQPFPPQPKRSHATKVPTLFQPSSRGNAATTAPNHIQGKNLKFTAHHGVQSDRTQPLAQIASTQSRLGDIENGGGGEFSLVEPSGRISPITSSRIPITSTPNPSKTLNNLPPAFGSPFSISQSLDPDGDPEDPYTQGLRLGATRVQKYKAEIHAQNLELEALKSSLNHETTVREQETISFERTLAELKQQHQADMSRLRERHDADFARSREDAARELAAKSDDATRLRDELLKLQESSRVCAERDLGDIELSKQKVEQIREVAKKAIDESNRQYADLLAMFQELKQKHDDSHKSVHIVASEVQHVKTAASQGITSLGSLVNEDIMKTRNRETMALITELQQDRDNSQQVNAMLRDKLLAVGSQLAEAQDRVRELESQQVARGNQLELHGRQLLETGDKLVSLSDMLNVREHDTLESLAEAARLEERAKNSEVRCEELTTDLESVRQQLESVKEINVTLSLKLEESVKAVSETKASQAEISTKLASSEETVQTLRSQLADRTRQHDSLLSENTKLSTDFSMMETQTRALEMQVNTMQSELEQSAVQLKAVNTAEEKSSHALLKSSEAARLLERELGATKEKARNLEQLNEVSQSALATAQREVEQLRLDLHASSQLVLQLRSVEASMESLNNANKKLEVSLASSEVKNTILQERCDGQNEALRLSREQCEDLQERLRAVDATYLTKWQAENSAYKMHTTSVDNSLASLIEECKQQATTKAHNATIDRSLSSIIEEIKQLSPLGSRIASMEGSLASLLEAGKRSSSKTQVASINDLLVSLVEEVKQSHNNAVQAERDLSRMRNDYSELCQAVANLSNELELARSAACSTPPNASTEISAELQAERMQTKLQQETINELQLKTRTLMQRYRAGDLDAQEQDFVALLMQEAQSLQEERMIANSNELRRKDSMITTLHKKIIALESMLARRLQAKEPDPGATVAQSNANSMINIDGFVLSSPTMDAIAQSTSEEMCVDPKQICPVNLHEEVKAAPQDSGTSEPREMAGPSSIPEKRTRARATNSRLDKKPLHAPPPVSHLNASGPPSNPPRQLKFTELDDGISDVSESDDEVPLMKLGKRQGITTAAPVPSNPPKKPKTATRKPTTTRATKPRKR